MERVGQTWLNQDSLKTGAGVGGAGGIITGFGWAGRPVRTGSAAAGIGALAATGAGALAAATGADDEMTVLAVGVTNGWRSPFFANRFSNRLCFRAARFAFSLAFLLFRFVTTSV